MPLVRFLAHKTSWEAEVPLGTTLLEAARASGAPEGDACGGVCACSTCHLYIVDGEQHLSEASDDEEDTLDKGFDVRMNSRLGCQVEIVSDGTISCDIAEESLDAFYNEHPDLPDPRRD